MQRVYLSSMRCVVRVKSGERSSSSEAVCERSVGSRSEGLTGRDSVANAVDVTLSSVKGRSTCVDVAPHVRWATVGVAWIFPRRRRVVFSG